MLLSTGQVKHHVAIELQKMNKKSKRESINIRENGKAAIAKAVCISKVLTNASQDLNKSVT